jgi:hypothetical protein
MIAIALAAAKSRPAVSRLETEGGFIFENLPQSNLTRAAQVRHKQIVQKPERRFQFGITRSTKTHR